VCRDPAPEHHERSRFRAGGRWYLMDNGPCWTKLRATEAMRRPSVEAICEALRAAGIQVSHP
jgi:hypothetical protein